ncbi:unnamed protein product [Lathyrus sativus]|nr:unnamed protein product [Lathyrus sativus]
MASFSLSFLVLFLASLILIPQGFATRVNPTQYTRPTPVLPPRRGRPPPTPTPVLPPRIYRPPHIPPVYTPPSEKKP